MALQFALFGLGPVGAAAAIAITAGMLIIGGMAAEDDFGISEDSPIYWLTHSDGDESPRQTTPSQPKVTTPSVTPSQASEYYEGGEVPVYDDDRKVFFYPDEEEDDGFDEETYTPGVLAPTYEPARAWGYVCVNETVRIPEQPDLDDLDEPISPPSSGFKVSASAYESGAKYMLIIAGLFLLALHLINTVADLPIRDGRRGRRTLPSSTGGGLQRRRPR